LDDGHQHLQIQRDLDIVLLDCTRPFWHYHPLPWGYAREGFSSLQESDIVILTRVNQSDPAQIEAILKILSSLKITSVIKCEIKAGHCEELKSRDAVEIRGKRTYLVSGIGNPESFEKSVGSSGAMIVGHDKRADHFQYTEKNIAAFMKAAKGKNSEILLLTEKDAVKWEEFHIPSSGTLKIAKLLTTLEFNPPLPRIYDLALKRFC
jgi:tetraacyldisaccharide 4'-kinase